MGWRSQRDYCEFPLPLDDDFAGKSQISGQTARHSLKTLQACRAIKARRYEKTYNGCGTRRGKASVILRSLRRAFCAPDAFAERPKNLSASAAVLLHSSRLTAI